jgi:hypothetical protein
MTLTEPDVDEVLRSAALRVHSMAARRSPLTVRPKALLRRRGTGLAVASVVAVLGVFTAANLMSDALRRSERLVAAPVFLTDGSSGEDVTLLIQPDDGDPETTQLISPIGARTVQIVTGSKAERPAGSTPPIDAAEAGRALLPWVCINVKDFGTCTERSPMTPAQLHAGYRSPTGSALVTWVPQGVAYVTMVAGDERWWARPVEGVVLFPFTASAGPNVTVQLLDADGRATETLQGSSPQVTQQFIEANRVTRQTDALLKSANNLEPFGRFTELAARANRMIGRDDGGLTFQGPFSVSAVSPATQLDERPTLRTSVVAAVTILPSDLPQLEKALEGTMFTQREPLASAPSQYESLVVIVATADVTAAEMAEARQVVLPARERTQVSLDRAWAWAGGATYQIRFDDIASLLMSAPVTLDQGRVVIRVARDDLGDVQVFASETESSRLVDDPSPATMSGVIRLLQPGVRSVRLTLSDGRVLTPSVRELPAPYSVSIVYAPELAGEWTKIEPDPSTALSKPSWSYRSTVEVVNVEITR